MRTAMTTTTKYAGLAALGLILSLLTACGGSSSKGETVTTLPNCPTGHYYNSSTDKFQYSQSDARECQVINTTTTTCASNEVRVRLPINQNYSNTATNTNCPYNAATGVRDCTYAQIGTPFVQGQTYNNNNNSNTINSNYHTISGQYSEVCVGQTNENWNYIIYGANYGYDYNWLNINQATAAWGYSVNYHGSVGAAINSGDIPSWIIPALGAGTGALIGHSIDNDNGAIYGGILGLGIGLILN